MGRSLPDYRVALTTPDNKEAEEGEISLRLKPAPLGLMQRYADDPKRSSAVLGGNYCLTGDVALDVFRFCRERMASFKRIRRIEFTDLPKTISGKIRRVQLRSLEGERFEHHERGPREYREEDFPELKGA
jgi:acyl-coenzyme A synthetase/AMP-(fatty) acid ligase